MERSNQSLKRRQRRFRFRPTAQRRGILRDQRGVTTFEYAVLLVCISVATVVAWVSFGQSLAGIFGDDYPGARRGSGPASPGSGTTSSSSGASSGPLGIGNMGPSPGTSGESGGFLSTIANSSVGQGVLGVGYGLQKSFTPGGFLAPSPTDRPAFQVGMGVGEIVGGATQMGRGSAITGAGVGIAGLGVATEGPSLGTSTIAVVGGAAVATAGVAIVANGVGSVAAGGNTILNAARGSGSDSASGGPTAAPGGDGAQGGEGKGLRRPYIRKGTRSEVEEAAPRDAEGRPIDPNTGKPIEGKADLGHKPGNEFRREKAAAEKEGLTQKKFNDRMNDPDKYQLEDPASNRSHKYEQKP